MPGNQQGQRGRLALLDRERIDLVILDLRFGTQEGGPDVLHYLHPVLYALPVVVCSAAIDELRSHKAQWATRDITVLPKPFDIAVFCDVVTAALRKSFG